MTGARLEVAFARPRRIDGVKGEPSSKRAEMRAAPWRSTGSRAHGGAVAAVRHASTAVASRGAHASEPLARKGRFGRAAAARTPSRRRVDGITPEKNTRKNTQVAMQDEDIDEALVREREAELRNINADVHKVNEIFRDLATLVDKQQDDVDKIGDLVERSHAHAEKGLDQVQKAAANQSSCALM